jgi:hypothetical protein
MRSGSGRIRMSSRCTTTSKEVVSNQLSVISYQYSVGTHWWQSKLNRSPWDEVLGAALWCGLCLE